MTLSCFIFISLVKKDPESPLLIIFAAVEKISGFEVFYSSKKNYKCPWRLLKKEINPWIRNNRNLIKLFLLYPYF